MNTRKDKQPSLRVRLAWLVGIWCASVAALGLAAWLMRLVMRLGGLST
jgi:hypothetical protein